MTRTNAFTVVVPLLLSVAAPASAVTFTDATFNPANYTLTTYKGSASVTTTLGQTANGHPGTALEGTYNAPGANPTGELFTAINNGFVYNPSVSGAIGTLSASLDRYFDSRIGSDPANIAAYTLRIFAVQNGNTYQAIFSTPSGQPGGYWLTLAQSGIMASDFHLFDSANFTADGTVTGLNYAGSAITFGFGMRAGQLVDSVGAPINDPSSGTLRADNFFLSVNGAVPEPATWAMMILGFGMVGGALRRQPRVRFLAA